MRKNGLYTFLVQYCVVHDACYIRVKDLLDRKEHLVSRVVLDPAVRPGNLVALDLKVRQELPVQLVFLDLQDLQVKVIHVFQKGDANCKRTP